jgi:hypothetical protein
MHAIDQLEGELARCRACCMAGTSAGMNRLMIP